MFEEINVKEMKDGIASRFEDSLSFGIPYLSDSCKIYKTDLIVISAATGLGKTELASMIGMENAKKGKRVTFFALEAFKHEIETRNIFRMAQTSYGEYLKNNNEFTRVYFTYDNYLNGKIPPELAPFVDEAENCVRVMSKYFNTVYREKSDYTIDQFCDDLTKIDLDTDLIIIDHLHFFDYDESKEYAEISKIVKKLRDLPLITEIPIVLVAHLRKNISKQQRPIPTIDDLHGSSNIAKVASKIVFISPDFKSEGGNLVEVPTIVRVAKNRYSGYVTRFVGILKYNCLTNNYSTSYDVGALNYFENDYEIMDFKPGWCK